MQINELHQLFLRSSGISTDTRNIKANSLYFALKGERFNGNHFAGKALEKGAAYALIDEAPQEEHPKFILVDNALESLQQLAAFHRKYLGIPIVALTGSNGKTTTKELIKACLSKSYRTIATLGNLNNHIGVPLTLLSMQQDTQVGIVEMGANHPSEIAFLCDITQPDLGYITNFGRAHLEGFGSPEGVIKAKSELYEHLKAKSKTLLLNSDDPIQKKQRGNPSSFSFGSHEDTDLQIIYPPAKPYASISVGKEHISSQLIGAYNATNMAAAYSVGIFFKVPEQELKTALENYSPTNNRSQILERGSSKIILDAYNANPTSMAAALDNLQGLQDVRKIAIFGDMFELGDYSTSEHQQLVERLERASLDAVYLIGENFYKTKSSPDINKYRTFEEFTAAFDPAALENASILIKGSRGMALERVLEL